MSQPIISKIEIKYRDGKKTHVLINSKSYVKTDEDLQRYGLKDRRIEEIKIKDYFKKT